MMFHRRMQKRGMSFEMIDWVVKLLFLVAICFLTIFIVRYNVVLSTEMQDARAFLFVQRVLSSPSGITYTDPLTGRTYPFIIDGDKLSHAQQSLEQSIKLSENDIIAAELDVAVGSSPVRSIFYNQQAYTQWKKGIIQGNHVGLSKSIPVLVAQNGTFAAGTVSINLITPKG